MLLMKHLDRNDNVRMLKGTKVKVHSVHLHPEDEREAKGKAEYILKHPPDFKKISNTLNSKKYVELKQQSQETKKTQDFEARRFLKNAAQSPEAFVFSVFLLVSLLLLCAMFALG